MSFATLGKTSYFGIDINTDLKRVTSNPHIGDVLAFDLLDGRHIECVVSDVYDSAIRFDSIDCLGDAVSCDRIEKWLLRIANLLPYDLRQVIVSAQRRHIINGEEVCCSEYVFLPAASELFGENDILGDEMLYEQKDWYKDCRHRIKMDDHRGTPVAYWTSSQCSGNFSSFCFVGSDGLAASNSASSTYLFAPICFHVRR